MDYTEIRDSRIRTKICKLMSDMLDNPDEHGIYPTSKFMWEMETFILAENAKLVEERDLAIAHDRQPYPTAQAYEKVCKAYHKAKGENAKLREALEKHRWIPVGEGWPEERKDDVPFRSEDVFVTNGISARRAYWMTRQKHWRFDGVGWSNLVTHWKPIVLPEQALKEHRYAEEA